MVNERSVERVLLAGDWHGNRDWAESCFAEAAARGCHALVQLGDFGLWPGREGAWLDHIDRAAESTGQQIVWIDGNHENHDSLDSWASLADERGLVQMRSNVWWATRGARWEWSGWRFGALGGAVSIDRFLRRQGVNWWPQEEVTEDDVDRLGDGPLDVLLTHSGPTASGRPVRQLPLPEAILRDAARVRDLIGQAVARTQPQLLVHGHYHLRLSYQVDGCRVEGLAHDGSASRDAWAVLRLGRTLELS